MVDWREPESEGYDIAQSRECLICLWSEIDNISHRLHNVDLVEGQGNQGNHILSPPQLL